MKYLFSLLLICLFLSNGVCQYVGQSDSLYIEQRIQDAKDFKVLSDSFSLIGNYKEAFMLREKYDVLKDSIQSVRKNELDFNMLQNKSKETENYQLKLREAQQKLIIKRRNNMSLVIGAGFLIVLGFLVFIVLQNEQKKVYNKALEEVVHVRTQELEDVITELKRFTYIASHDLKEPLRNISGFVSLIERNIQKNNPQKNMEYIQYVRKNTKQLYDLIQDILSYSSVNQRDVELKYVSLHQMVDQFKEEHSRIINSKGCSIMIDDESGFSLPSTLYLAVKNVLSNGMKYNDKTHPQVQISTELSGDLFVVNIEDNGIGIESKYYDKVFSMFVRLHNREQYEGSGLGLAISKKVLEHFGGDISIESRLGVGSVFTLVIPVTSLGLDTELREVKGFRKSA